MELSPHQQKISRFLTVATWILFILALILPAWIVEGEPLHGWRCAWFGFAVIEVLIDGKPASGFLYFFLLALANLALIFDLFNPRRAGRIVLVVATILVFLTPHVPLTFDMIPSTGFRLWQAAFVLALLRPFKDNAGPLLVLIQKIENLPFYQIYRRRILIIVTSMVIAVGGVAGYHLWRPFDEKWRAVQSWDLEQNDDFALKEKSSYSKLRLSEVPNTGAMLLTHDTVLYSEPFLIRIDAKTGRQLWQREDRCHSLHPRGKITPLYAVTNCDEYGPVLAPQIEELNPDTGATIRTLSLQFPAYTNPETGHEFAREQGKYYFANDQIYFLDMFGITAFDPRDGKILFNIFFTNPEAGLNIPTSDPIITTEVLLFKSDAGLSAYSLLDGHFLYDVEAICCASSVTPDGKRLITRHSFDYHDQNRNNTVEIDLATGKVIHTYLGDNFNISNAGSVRNLVSDPGCIA